MVASEAWHWERAALIDERAVEIMQRDENSSGLSTPSWERIDRTAELKPDVLAELKRFSKQDGLDDRRGQRRQQRQPVQRAEAVIRT